MTAKVDLALGARSGLPDALRVLLSDYPREAWESHPRFSALIRFWLDRHLMFRRMQGLLVAETRGFIDGDRDPQAFAAGLARLGGMFVNELHGHHAIEDHHYFPVLRGLDPRIEAGFDLLDADHLAIDPLLHALADRANAVLSATGAAEARAPAGLLLDELVRFDRFLDRHLVDEEELVVPVILDRGPDALR
jgi:iron-sulfur cluster repair protein YtfE (RIC family)